ncbi:MAG: preprotein translocase subunit SecG [Nannocystis sp.]|nr:preprotein translocase subunit SecG [Nannocystis sp.]
MDILEILKTVVTVAYVPICVVMILIILLQAGKGGMGTALGGGASQGVFGGGGASDVMAKLTQGFAFAFMAGAVFLAYATAHGGSERLREKSEEMDVAEAPDPNQPIDYERIGPNPLVLPFPGGSAPTAIEAEEAPAAEPVVDASASAVDAAPLGEVAPEGDSGAAEPVVAAEPVEGAPASDTPASDTP